MSSPLNHFVGMDPSGSPVFGTIYPVSLLWPGVSLGVAVKAYTSIAIALAIRATITTSQIRRRVLTSSSGVLGFGRVGKGWRTWEKAGEILTMTTNSAVSDNAYPLADNVATAHKLGSRTPLVLKLKFTAVVVLVPVHEGGHDDPFCDRRPSDTAGGRHQNRRLCVHRVLHDVIRAGRTEVDVGQVWSVIHRPGEDVEGNEDRLAGIGLWRFRVTASLSRSWH